MYQNNLNMIRILIFSISIIFSMALHAQDMEQSNKHFWNTLETSAPPEVIWNIWTDVSSWQIWDTELEEASLNGNFAKGTKGKLVPKKGRKAKFKIIAFEQGKSYTFKTNLPLGGLYVKRTLEIRNGKTYFTHEVWFKGLTKGIFAKALGKEFRRVLPSVMENIKIIAEEK